MNPKIHNHAEPQFVEQASLAKATYNTNVYSFVQFTKLGGCVHNNAVAKPKPILLCLSIRCELSHKHNMSAVVGNDLDVMARTEHNPF